MCTSATGSSFLPIILIGEIVSSEMTPNYSLCLTFLDNPGLLLVPPRTRINASWMWAARECSLHPYLKGWREYLECDPVVPRCEQRRHTSTSLHATSSKVIRAFYVTFSETHYREPREKSHKKRVSSFVTRCVALFISFKTAIPSRNRISSYS